MALRFWPIVCLLTVGRVRMRWSLRSMVDQMGLDLSLRTAMSGLRTVQKGLDTVSSNIANADTPGYTRKWS